MRSSTRLRVRRTTSESRILEAFRTLLRDGRRPGDLAVEEILTAAGVSRSTFYSYFADKNELLTRAAEPVVEAYTQLADTWWQRDQIAGAAPPAWDALAALNEQFIAVARDHREVFLALTEVGGAPDGGPLAGIVDRYAERIAARLIREQSEGLVSADVIPDVTARFIITATMSAIHDHLARGRRTGDAALARTLGHAFWFAIYGAPPASSA
ncbi:TetR/AcrR family transcriptional regulator [Mycobacterium sp. M26]|uniref:TetR/AcrR family transcriptional regulator n=1 Tax=Mycobacterium sp. M26 TaxID=1762962 RepID=UPI00073EA937|nr:TetR/AcrR family transcriptional regulator [Mycobacterium sp. M26]